MDITAFNEAQEAYAAGDYKRALAGFSVCSRGIENLEPEEAGKFFHLIGNCYIKSGAPGKAAEFYAKALEVSSADRKPSLHVNLGTALLAADRNEEAISAFADALGYTTYPTPYKAYSGIGSAQLKLGNMTEAGAAYREAALDPANPMPGKSLVNLGVCFMELGRTDDAIVSYETALDLGLSPKASGKARANLGQAYMTQGRVADAIAAFEAAEADGYELSPIARHDLDIARMLESRFGETLAGTAYDPAPEASEGEPEAEFEEQVEAEEMPEGEAEFEAEREDEQFAEGEYQESEEWDEEYPEGEFVDPAADTIAFPAVVADSAEDAYLEDGSYAEADGSWFEAASDEEADLLPSPEDTAFFDLTEEEINANGKKAEKDRKKKKKGRRIGLKIFLTIVVLIILVAAAGVAAYILGYGYPTQEQVASQFVDSVMAGNGGDEYWAADSVSTSHASQEAELVCVDSYKIVSVERSTDLSVVYLEADLMEGGKLDFAITMGRSNYVTWAVESVEPYFPSEH